MTYNNKDLEAIIKSRLEYEESSRVIVKIPHDEKVRIVVNELKVLRKAYIERKEDATHFDAVLKHYLDEEEFQKYVIEEKEIEF